MSILCSCQNSRIYSGLQPQNQVEKEDYFVDKHKEMGNLVSAGEDQA